MPKRFVFTTITLLGLAITFPAAADVQVYKDPNGGVYISGLQNGQFVQIAYGDLRETIHVKPQGKCKFIKLPYKNFYPWGNVDIFLAGGQAPILSFDGSNLNASDIRGSGTNLCSGTARNTALPWTDLGGGAYGIKNGLVQGNATAAYIFGLPNAELYDAKDINPALRKHKVNGCGFIKLTDTAKWPTAKLGSFYYYLGPNPSNDSYSVSNLPVKAPEICHQGMLYKPAS